MPQQSPQKSASEQLADAFRKALALPASADVTGLAYRQHKAWDSVAHMQLVSHIESAFGIMLDTEDVIGMSSHAVAVEILKRHGVHADAA